MPVVAGLRLQLDGITPPQSRFPMAVTAAAFPGARWCAMGRERVRVWEARERESGGAKWPRCGVEGGKAACLLANGASPFGCLPCL
jgi:hypothetical protein